jgi:two-component system, chemotaxis family, sensor kinase CheA
MDHEQEQAFLKRLRATFGVEADEHLKAMSALLLRMEHEGGAAAPALLESLFREAHSLKGAARAVNLPDVEDVCQALESVLADLKQRPAMPAPEFFDALYRALDTVRRLLDSGDDGNDGPALLAAAEAVRVLEAQQHALRERGQEPAAVSEPAAPAAAVGATGVGDTVRIATGKLDALMVQAEEMLAFKFGSEHLAQHLRNLRNELDAWRRGCEKNARDARAACRASRGATASYGGRGVPPVERWLEAAEREAVFASELAARFNRIELSARRERRMLGGMIDHLLEDMKQALMQPFSALLELFPRLVRDLAQHGGKKVDLVIDGASLEIDRRILEQMKDPLIHLLRNAVDHGIEAPELRLRSGKPARGRIRIGIRPHDGGRVELLIEDDGRGIDAGEVKAAALKLGVLSAEAAQGIGERDALALIFASGLSTSAALTDISGRGLGLAIVREKVEGLGGGIAVGPGAGGGTCFRISLPTSLATFRGLLVRLGEQRFVLPSRNVERVARLAPAAIKTVGQRDTMAFDGEMVALVRLDEVLGIAPAASDGRNAPLQVVLLAEAGKRVAFVVDQVIGDQDVLAKGLGPQLLRVPNIAGATVLGAGLAVPVLNVADLLKSAQRAGVASVRQPASAPAVVPRRSVLVAEDSITSRSLLQHVLQSAGYEVRTAVDGVEALDALRSGEFDLLLSDVEMSRMDGFTLTARIRADPRTAELPVVLLTSLESREQKERGVEAGANAYIVKSAFDRERLLDVIRSLI